MYDAETETETLITQPRQGRSSARHRRTSIPAYAWLLDAEARLHTKSDTERWDLPYSEWLPSRVVWIGTDCSATAQSRLV
ncbi:hypothetical protein CLCR_11105 [Cladophialophora carrionii]|uniref:Uncharacterized protein n=1 Tax=Cladophialophora carrionii TaxID=86049 RepID=A0A1C1CZ42_9EURO|nr:hypothetical protein CLCR_11105 [Cladophialophora carrionii]